MKDATKKATSEVLAQMLAVTVIARSVSDEAIQLSISSTVRHGLLRLRSQ